MKKTVIYSSTGLVYGNYWGGGKGAYSARPLLAETQKELIAEATKGVESGSLDGGMGYESLIGAALVIRKTTSVTIGGKNFTNHQYKTRFVGKMKASEKIWLREQLINNY